MLNLTEMEEGAEELFEWGSDDDEEDDCDLHNGFTYPLCSTTGRPPRLQRLASVRTFDKVLLRAF